MRFVSSGKFRSLGTLGRVGVVVVLLGVTLGGCTVTSFLGRQFTNFTAYYNKFHNANAAFEEGVESIEERERTIDRTQYLSVFLEPGEQVNESPFDKAIQKSADVLREHPESKWVDDALLLIGKSYFYQRNYVGAAQKFREAIALNGEREQEARFWLARTLVSTERYEAATEVIRTGIEGREEGAWAARLQLVRGQLLTQQEQWEEATRALNTGLEGDLPDELAARAAFLLGQTLETMGRPGPARAAYREARSYDPFYALDFAARLNDIELQGSHGDADRALDRLEDLETDEKNYEQRGEMAVVRARIYREQGQNERARRTLQDMLYREEAPSGASRGRLHYDLARLYRDAFKDFRRAAAHFDTASTSLGSSAGGDGERTARRLPTAPVDAGTQANRYRDLAERARTVARLDSLLRLGQMSDSAFRAYVEELRRERQAAEQEAREEAASSRSRRLQGRGRGLARERQGSAPAADTRQSDAGFLFHKDPARVQRGRRQFEQTWGDRPLVDNWRRQVAIRSTGTPAAENEGGAGEQDETSSVPAGENASAEANGAETALDLSAVPRDSASLAEMESKRTVARYELANSLFLAASRPDSAATWYRRILQESGDHPVVKRALYALAEAYRAQGDTTSAQQTYRRLVDRYPSTDLARRARQRLDLSQQERADDRRARADSAYARAYNRWQAGRRNTLLASFLGVATRYPDVDTAPRALLAAGIVYWKHVQRDSADAPRSVLERYVGELRPPDSTRVDSAGLDSGTDSLRSRPAMAGEPDTLRASPADSSAGPMGARPPRAARRDTTRRENSRPPDSLRSETGERSAEGRESNAPPDSTTTEKVAGASPRTTADADQAPSVYDPLEALMTLLVERYPDAPQVSQARSLLDLIEDRRKRTAPLVADTAAVDTAAEQSRPPAVAKDPDTTGADTAAAVATRKQSPRDRSGNPSSSTDPDTTESTPSARDGEEENDKTVLPAPPGRDAAGGANESGGESDIDPARGGWTVLVQTTASAQQASVRIAEVGRLLGDQWPVELLKEKNEGATRYRLVVGQFQSRRAASEALENITEQIASESRVWALENVGTLTQE